MIALKVQILPGGHAIRLGQNMERCGADIAVRRPARGVGRDAIRYFHIDQAFHFIQISERGSPPCSRVLVRRNTGMENAGGAQPPEGVQQLPVAHGRYLPGKTVMEHILKFLKLTTARRRPETVRTQPGQRGHKRVRVFRPPAFRKPAECGVHAGIHMRPGLLTDTFGRHLHDKLVRSGDHRG